MKNSVVALFVLVVGLLTSLTTFAQTDLVQIHQDFSNDPGWEFRNNRIVAEDRRSVKVCGRTAPLSTSDIGRGVRSREHCAGDGLLR